MNDVKKHKNSHPASKHLDSLRQRVERAVQGAGAEAQAQQRALGKLTARERIDLVLDEGTFEEIDLLVESRGREFGLDARSLPGDGVVGGTGSVGGRNVCIYAQDFTVHHGTLGQAQARKICKVLDMAMTAGIPVIALCDTLGARLEEGVDSLGGYGEIFYRHVQASGYIPQICAVLGPCSGGAVYSPALMDFVFMVDGTSHMYISSPAQVEAATGESCDKETLGGALTHSSKSGVCHFLAGSEHDCFRQIRELLEYLPQNCRERPKSVMPSDHPHRESPLLEAIAQMESKKPYRMHDVIWEIADGHQFFEVHKNFACNVGAGFIRLNGETVGVVANNPIYLSGSLDISASEKAARFVRFCDCFNIPLLTLVDVPGYWPGMEQEFNGIIRKGAKLVYAYCQASVPKVTLILHKAYGGAYEVMGSKHIRGDINFAWPCAEIAVMGASRAVDMLYEKQLKTSPDAAALKKDLVEKYQQEYSTPYPAASRGFIDEIIEPKESRAKIIRAFEFLKGKQVPMVSKKHGNIPF